MTRERLESLSIDELKRLAAKEHILFPAHIAREKLIDLIQELLEELMEERAESNNPSVKIEETKYHISQDEEIEVWDKEDVTLPKYYSKTRIVLMSRDPYWAFTYWEIEGKKLEKIQSEPDFGGLYLRVHDVKLITFNGKNSNYNFDIPILDTDHDWYINVPHPDSNYLIELIYVQKGEEHILTRSNTIRTPRDKMVEQEEDDKPDVQTAEIIELTHQELFRLPSSWGPIPQRINSFINLKYLRQSD